MSPAVAIVSNLERLNGFGSRHWKMFAGQDYFDEHGVFMGAMLGAPLLLIMFIILVCSSPPPLPPTYTHKELEWWCTHLPLAVNIGCSHDVDSGGAGTLQRQSVQQEMTWLALLSRLPAALGAGHVFAAAGQSPGEDEAKSASGGGSHALQ